MPNNNIYNVNWGKLLNWLLPEMLRKPKLLAFMNALVFPIQLLHIDLLRFKKQKEYQLSINSQVCRMQAMLNDKYDSGARRIYIDDGHLGNSVYVFTAAENTHTWLFKSSENNPLYVYNRNEIKGTAAHFIVYIPTILNGNINIPELTSLVNIYKLPGKRWQIKYF